MHNLKHIVQWVNKRVCLCSQQPNQDIGYFHHPKENVSHSCQFPFPLCSTTALISFTTDEFYLFLNFINLESFSVYFFVSAFFVQHIFQIHPHCCMYQYLINNVLNTDRYSTLYIHMHSQRHTHTYLVYLSTCSWTFRLFPCFDCYEASINTPVQVCLWTYIFISLWSGIIRTYGRCVNFIRNGLFSKVVVIFYTSFTSVWQFQSLYILTNIWCSHSFLILAMLVVKWSSITWFKLHFLMSNDVEHLFLCAYWPFVYLFLCSVCSRPLII